MCQAVTRSSQVIDAIRTVAPHAQARTHLHGGRSGGGVTEHCRVRAPE